MDVLLSFRVNQVTINIFLSMNFSVEKGKLELSIKMDNEWYGRCYTVASMFLLDSLGY